MHKFTGAKYGEEYNERMRVVLYFANNSQIRRDGVRILRPELVFPFIFSFDMHFLNTDGILYCKTF